MIIYIARLQEGVSERVAGKLDAKELDVECVDLHYKGKIAVEGTAEKILNTLTFHGTIGRTIEHICARCLKAVDEKIEEPIDLAYEIKGLTEIDMTADIRDALILSHPEHFLCHANCNGLCPHCGIDLNVEQCHCKKESKKEIDSHPFSSLQSLKSWNQKRS